jgi:hypothetical protein
VLVGGGAGWGELGGRAKNKEVGRIYLELALQSLPILRLLIVGEELHFPLIP